MSKLLPPRQSSAFWSSKIHSQRIQILCVSSIEDFVYKQDQIQTIKWRIEIYKPHAPPVQWDTHSRTECYKSVKKSDLVSEMQEQQSPPPHRCRSPWRGGCGRCWRWRSARSSRTGWSTSSRSSPHTPPPATKKHQIKPISQNPGMYLENNWMKYEMSPFGPLLRIGKILP